MKAVLESNLKHLGLIPEFRRKVVRAFKNRQGETFRVHWRPYGWIRFVPRADSNYVGFQEDETQQQPMINYLKKKTVKKRWIHCRDCANLQPEASPPYCTWLQAFLTPELLNQPWLCEGYKTRKKTGGKEHG